LPCNGLQWRWLNEPLEISESAYLFNISFKLLRPFRFNRTVFLLFLVAASVGCSVNSNEQKLDYARAIPPAVLRSSCVLPNKRELAMYEVAASAIELNGADQNWLAMGAERFLAAHLFRKDEKTGSEVCPPLEIFTRVSEAISLNRSFGKTRIVEYQLELAAKLPNPSEYIIDSVASVAFSNNVQLSETNVNLDIRPYARTLLAKFGLRAVKYQQIAFAQISSDSPMGTGAAQVAVASGHPKALEKIEQLMNEVLLSLSSNRFEYGAQLKRLEELSWALSFAGDGAKQHLKPVHAILRLPRNIPDGLPPVIFCNLIERFEGKEFMQMYKDCLQ
jgi:hypothetical protein